VISGLIYGLRIIAFRRQAWHSPVDREHPSVLGAVGGGEKRLIVGSEERIRCCSWRSGIEGR
jgi:hypothetical protein